MVVMKHYRNMLEIFSYTSVSLTKITSSKVIFEWNKLKSYVFEEIKRIVARDVLLPYPVCNEEFKIRTNAIKLQL